MESQAQSASVKALAQKGYWPATALEYFSEGKYSRAVDLCRRMLESEPDIVSGRVILAKSLFHAGQYEDARDQFLDVLRRDPLNLVAMRYLGDILFLEGEIGAAMAYYHRIFEINPYSGGFSSPLASRQFPEQTRQITIKRGEEEKTSRRALPLVEPIFVTETVGDIYREQGYYLLAGEVYRRLLMRSENNRLASKLKEVENQITDKG